LSELSSDNPVQKRLVDEMLSLARANRGIPQDYRTARTERIDDAAQIVREGIAALAMRHIDDLASQMRAEEDRLFIERTTSATVVRRWRIMTGIGSGLVVVLAGISIILVRRSARARDDAEALLRDQHLISRRRSMSVPPISRGHNELQRFGYIVSRSALAACQHHGFTSELEELARRYFQAGSRYQPCGGLGCADGCGETEPVLEAKTSSSRRILRSVGIHQVVDRQEDRLITAVLNLTRAGAANSSRCGSIPAN